METSTAALALDALAQETRLEVFRLLVQAGEAGLEPGAIAARLGVAPSTLSFHLNALAVAGLIGRTRLGRRLVYRADYAQMNALVAYLTENCCGGRPCQTP